jgi:CBS domain containing-hemolysin-like protein
MIEASDIWVIAITVLLSAFFSGTEIAYLSANKLRIELNNQQGKAGARLMTFFIKNPSYFFATTLVGNNIAIVLYSLYSAKVITAIFVTGGLVSATNNSVIFLLQTVIGSLFILIFGEFIPKAVFRSAPTTTLGIVAWPFRIFYIVLFPLVYLVDAISRLILRYIMGMKVEEQTPQYDRQDLFHYINESRSTNDEVRAVEVDKEIFKNAIEFPSIQVRDCMIPRTDIVAIEVTAQMNEVQRLLTETGHSKLLIYRDSIDNIIGYIHVVDLFRNPASLDKMVIPIMIATEGMPASVLLQQFIAKRRSVAVVVDEFGGTSGMITMEDIIEQIVGDIEDEYDTDDLVEKKIEDNEFIFSARLEIDYINEKFNLDLPEGDYETLGGLIFYVIQEIPKKGQIIQHDHFVFTILSTDQARIKEVCVKVITAEQE